MTSEIPKFYPTFPKQEPLKEDIVGKAREFVDEFEENIKGQGIYQSLGIKSDKIYLLQGPPGLGKTFSVNALNNTMNSSILNETIKLSKKQEEQIKSGKEVTIRQDIKFSDFNLILMEYDIGKYGTAYINMSSRIVQGFFDTAFFYSQMQKPVLISMDECDALLTSRQSNIQTHSEDRKVLETIMKNLQIAHDTDNVYVTMMTNVPEIIDEASIRAGRIDRKISLDLPTFKERKIGFENAIEQVNMNAGYKVIRSYSAEPLAELSNGFNYADIWQTINSSLREKAKELIRTKSPGIIRAGYIKQNKLEKAVKSHKREFKTTTRKKIGFI